MSAVNTDTDTILEALNDKLDRDANNLDTSTTNFDVVVDYQVPTAANNYMWYRKYSSGWVEQGGYVDYAMNDNTAYTINLPISMTSINYSVNLQVCKTYDMGTNNNNAVCYSKSTTSFQFQKYEAGDPSTAGNYGISWEVKGMAAA